MHFPGPSFRWEDISWFLHMEVQQAYVFPRSKCKSQHDHWAILAPRAILCSGGSLAEGEFEPLTMRSIKKILTTELSWHLERFSAAGEV